MSEKTRYNIEVAGVGLSIVSDDPAEFVHATVDKVDRRIREITRQNPRISPLDAAILCSIDFLGAAQAAGKQIKNLEAQITLYEANIARLRSEHDASRKSGDIDELFREAAPAAATPAPDTDDSADAPEKPPEPMTKRLDSFRDQLRNRHAEQLERLKQKEEAEKSQDEEADEVKTVTAEEATVESDAITSPESGYIDVGGDEDEVEIVDGDSE